ncbi:hypothetical protein O7635_32900 [Asanoa sp. WMMD1127]|uniref:DUF6882 domain-containing protein n=1 Tax=Asanoa sp. WMMD1127 TaxID=3016107 RepID=UPI002415DF3A|nr:DUF6882 domain-containing protein [Asanoa sp. WMMD1127]MDG4826673.1 hypothetical protein [Asanoa sp. WMMD1127]
MPDACDARAHVDLQAQAARARGPERPAAAGAGHDRPARRRPRGLGSRHRGAPGPRPADRHDHLVVPGRVATAPAQILASYNRAAGSWLWAWANESVLPDLSRDSRRVRDWAREHGHATLEQPQLQADDDLAHTLTALAVRITEAGGFYQPTNGAVIPIITFGPVTVSPRAGDGPTARH